MSGGGDLPGCHVQLPTRMSGGGDPQIMEQHSVVAECSTLGSLVGVT